MNKNYTSTPQLKTSQSNLFCMPSQQVLKQSTKINLILIYFIFSLFIFSKSKGQNSNCLTDTITPTGDTNYWLSMITPTSGGLSQSLSYYFPYTGNYSYKKFAQIYNNNGFINWGAGDFTVSGVSFAAYGAVQVGSSDYFNIEIRELNGSNMSCADVSNNCDYNNPHFDSVPSTLLYSIPVSTSALSNFNNTIQIIGINFPTPVQIPANKDFAIIFDFSTLSDDTIKMFSIIENDLGYSTLVLGVTTTTCTDAWVEFCYDQYYPYDVYYKSSFGLIMQNHALPQTHNLCPNQPINLNYNWRLGSPTGGTYSWSPQPDSFNGPNATYSPAVSQTVTCTYTSTCGVVESTIFNLNVINPPVINAGSDISICSGDSITLNPSIQTNYTSFSWTGNSFSSQNNLTPTISPAETGYFTFSATNTNGCTAYDSLIINVTSPGNQAVCLVTADSATGNHNVVVWEKPAQHEYLSNHKIYREISINNFQPIGIISSDSLSIFNDFTANPNTTSYRYKISGIDTCGHESALSDYHSTIHLQYLGFGNFQWSSYEIENLSNQVSSYNFYRDDFSTGNFQVIQVIPGSNNTFTDINFSNFPNGQYRVDINWLNGLNCIPSRVISSSYSNIYQLSQSNKLQALAKKQISIYPNPVSEELVFEIPVTLLGKTFTLYNQLGEKIMTGQLNSIRSEFKIGDIPSGSYTVALDDLFQKLVILNQP
jgi:hypothetical protein